MVDFTQKSVCCDAPLVCVPSHNVVVCQRCNRAFGAIHGEEIEEPEMQLEFEFVGAGT